MQTLSYLPDLLARVPHDPPFYVYDEGVIRSVCRQFLALPWRPLSVHFATMANVHPRFLEVVREEGVRLFVNSRGHLEVAVQVGFRPEEAIFTASAMDDATLRLVHDLGVQVNLDSLGQVARWRALFPGAPFGVRCNVGDPPPAARTRGAFIGRQSRLGLTAPELRTLAGSPDVVGLHLYVGTDILDLSCFDVCYRQLLPWMDRFPGLSFVDVGGGFAAGEGHGAFNLAGYGTLVAAFLEEASARAGRRLRLVLEPGRILGADAGFFACRVVDVKRRGRRQLLGVNASSAQFPRPLLYPDSARHPVTLLRDGAVVLDDAQPTTIFGCSTYSRDFLARDTALPVARPGDLVCLGQAGAYCASSHTRFLGFPPAPEHFLP